MKKWLAVMCLVMSMAGNVSLAIGDDYGQDGPAPNSGDGVSDGSGFEGNAGNSTASPGDGPAPNSGDGVSDGSGF